MTTLQNTVISPCEWQVVKKTYKKSPRESNPLPLLAQEEASPMHGMQISADETYSRAGVQFYIDCTQILVFATAVPLA